MVGVSSSLDPRAPGAPFAHSGIGAGRVAGHTIPPLLSPAGCDAAGTGAGATCASTRPIAVHTNPHASTLNLLSRIVPPEIISCTILIGDGVPGHAAQRRTIPSSSAVRGTARNLLPYRSR